MRGRRVARPEAEQHVRLEPQEEHCRSCGIWMPVAYHAHRKILTMKGLIQLRLVVRRCPNPTCQAYKQPYRPEEEGRWDATPWGKWSGSDCLHRPIALSRTALSARDAADLARTRTAGL